MRYKSITIALDMYGCPNRCKHCWVGHTPNGNMTSEELRFAAEQFRPFTDCLVVDDWYREPDYKDNYRELWKLSHALSDQQHEHFELISVWRIVRDQEYVKWLASLGLKKAQLTLFGGQEKTDFYTGRKNAYQEILQAIEILLENHISPRIQFFINQDTVDELSFVEKLIHELDLENRCKAFGGEFSFFIHQGSCDGENEKLYDIRVTPEELQKIPSSLAAYTLKHFQRSDLSEVFGKTEQALYEELSTDFSTASYVSETPVFHIDRNFYVYPNVSTPAPYWCLGNLKTDGAGAVLEAYSKEKSLAQHTRATVPLCEIVKTCGDPQGRKLFTKGDYIEFLLNQYCRR